MVKLFRQLLVVFGLFGFVLAPAASTRQPSTSGGPLQTPPPVDDPRYAKDVQQLLQTTYLGHANQEPDPEESVDVLKQYLQLNVHGSTEKSVQQHVDELDQQISQWRTLIGNNPSSRHAVLGLAKLLNVKADISLEANDRRAAAEAFIRAGDIALQHGLVRYTHEISRTLVAAYDPASLDRTFERILQVARRATVPERYIALVDYADGLSRLHRPAAESYFEEAIKTNPENNVEAINRYALHLLGRDDPRTALTLLEKMSPVERMMNGLPMYLRKEALQKLGLDTRSADEEIAADQSRMSAGIGGVATPPAGITVAAGKGGVRPEFFHYYQTDDCRDPTYQAQLWCSSHGQGCWWPYTVNFGEIIFNEARSEPIGAQAMVAWTIRDRALQPIGCDSYVGGYWYYSGYCEYLPCNFGSPYTGECPQAKKYCCVEHGATFGWGNYQEQYNDAHQILEDLEVSTTIYRAYRVLNSEMVERSTNFVPSGVSGCYMDCVNTYCVYGVNYWSPSPLGPMEYRSYVYTPAGAGDCKWTSGFVCSWNGTAGNYFWNRSY